MRGEVTWVLALGAAALVPTCLTVAYLGAGAFMSPYPSNDNLIPIAILSFMISLGHVFVLGIPGLWLLSKMGQMKAWTVCVLGFVCGCFPASIFLWPMHASIPGTWSSHREGEKLVQTPVNGVPTLPVWIDYLEGVLAMGMLGAAAAFVFWQVWKLSGPDRPRF